MKKSQSKGMDTIDIPEVKERKKKRHRYSSWVYSAYVLYMFP